MAWLALGAAGAFLFVSERQLNERRTADRVFDLRARDLSDALADIRASQQAYVAAGQGSEFWVPKVGQTADAVQKAAAEMRALASGRTSREALDAAADAFAQFQDADRRTREYLRASQPLMAADVIFGEGRQAAADASRQIEAARVAEHETFDAVEGRLRRQQALALGAAGGFSAFVLLVLGLTVPGARPAAPSPASLSPGTELEDSLPLRLEPAAGRSAAPRPPTMLPGLDAAADLCTAFGRIARLDELEPLIGRASEALNAVGVIVWLSSASGSRLEPVLAHGYSAERLSRLPTVPRDADNAAATAYRTGALQVVHSAEGHGALVAPILAADGAIGALSVELAEGNESSASVQALARIVAAQLAGVMTPPPQAAGDARTAAAV